MAEQKYLPIEEMELFLLFESVSDWAWSEVQSWSPFFQNTIGSQLIRSADSVGANLVEGDGRYSDADSNRHFIIARASAREARLWIMRAVKRGLVSAEAAEERLSAIDNASRMLNKLIAFKRQQANAARATEPPAIYGDAEETNYLGR